MGVHKPANRSLVVYIIWLLCISLVEAAGNQCPVGKFADKSGDCQPCLSISNCLKTVCSGLYDATCDQCDDGYTGDLCLGCIPGFYRRANTCRRCSPTPAACNNGIAVCSNERESQCQCPVGTYVASDNAGGYSCVSCASIPHCEVATCQGSGSSICDTCEAGYAGPTCQSCTAGTYAMETSAGVECSPCPKIARCTASACSSPDDAYCVLCEKGYTGSDCSECDQGFHMVRTACKPCAAIPNCRADPVCSGTGAGTCPLCKRGYEGDACDKCALGYFRKGRQCLACPRLPECPSSTTCTSADDAKCADCPIPAAIANGQVTGTFEEGQKITYTCDDGYILNGLSTRTCLDGQWTGMRPQCVEGVRRRSIWAPKKL